MHGCYLYACIEIALITITACTKPQVDSLVCQRAAYVCAVMFSSVLCKDRLLQFSLTHTEISDTHVSLVVMTWPQIPSMFVQIHSSSNTG